jgi:ribosome-binding protein aMBF1 (putative translation factor)
MVQRLHLKTARRHRKWRIGALSDAAHLNRTTITRLEHGDTVPSDSTRRRLEALLGLPLGGLIFPQSDEHADDRCDGQAS